MHKARMKGRRRTKVIIDALWVDGEGRMHVELKRKVLAQAADEEELVGLLGDLLLVLLFWTSTGTGAEASLRANICALSCWKCSCCGFWNTTCASSLLK